MDFKFWKDLYLWTKLGIIFGIFGFIMGVLNFICNKEYCIIFVLFPPILGSLSYYFADYSTIITNNLPKLFGIFVYGLFFSISYLLFGILIGKFIIFIKRKYFKK